MDKAIRIICMAACAGLFGLNVEAAAATPPTWAESYGVGSFGGDRKPTDEFYYGSGYDYPTGIAAMPDGGVVVAGRIGYPKLYTPYVGTPGGRDEATIVRFAADGTILWQRDLDLPTDQFSDAGNGKQNFTPALCHVYEIAADAQGNVFVGGGKGNTANGGEFPFVAKFSPDGQLIWQNGISEAEGTFGNPPQTYKGGLYPISHMGLTADGGVVMITGQTRPNQAYTILVFAKFDANGAVSIYKAFEHPRQYTPSGPICQTKDGSRYVVALPNPLSKAGNGTDVNGTLLLILDLDGNIIGQRGWASPDAVGEEPIRIIATADGGIAALARRGDNGAAGLVLRKFNADATAATIEKSIYMTPRFSAFAVQSLSETADGGFLIGGRTSFPGGSANDVLLIKTSAAGALEAASLVGGSRNEGYSGTFGTPESVYATATTDGGYGFACWSDTYRTGQTDKPDWWIGKTDANRHIRNFSGTLSDEDLAIFADVGEPHAPIAVSDYTTPGYSAGPVVSALPTINVLDPSTFDAPDAPSVVIQASGPRIVSAREAQAVTGQHFTYYILAAFFDGNTPLTYSASGLPTNFAIDPNTGVISGAPKAGSETNTPLPITLQVTDGTETATLVLQLTISVGPPVLTVNGSDTPASGLADTPLQFAADYAGRQAGQKVSVQASTDGTNFADLPTGTAGFMKFDASSGRYVLNTTNYPQQDGVRFRVRVVVPSRPDLISNVVGPFNLASGNQRAGQTLFRVLRNGLRADFDFRVTQVSPAPGVALRVQSSFTPGDEASWTDIKDTSGNNISGMNADDPTHFSVATNSIKPTRGIYFRAVAAASGFVDSLSNIIGPFALSSLTPPQVTIHTPGNGGDRNNPQVFQQSADGTAVISISAHATANGRPLAALTITFDGATIGTLDTPPSGELYTVNYQTDRIGDHVIEVLAFDDAGVVGRAASASYIRIVPAPATAAKAAKAAGSVAKAAAVHREIFKVASSGGDWDDPNTWRDSRNNPGVPSSADFVVIGNASVLLHGATVFALSIDGGHIVGPGQLQINNMLTINGGSFDAGVTLVIRQGAICQMNNAGNVTLDGLLQNQGTMNVHGARGLTGISDFLNIGIINFQKVLLPTEQIAKNLPLDLRAIEAANINLSGKVGQSFVGPQIKLLAPSGATLIGNAGGTLIGNAGGTLITNDGGGLITNDGGGLIGNDGGGLISNDGGGVISNDGNSLITNDGAGLITNDGGGLISNDGGGLTGPNGAAFKVPGGAQAQKASAARAATAQSGLTISGGEVDLTGLMLAAPVTVDAGVLSGTGLVAGSLTNNGGFISPGHSPGTLLVTGNFAQGANGTLVVEAAGAEPGAFDRLEIRGAAALGGKLQVSTIGGYVPLPDDPINPLGYANVSGGFDSVSGNVQLNFGPGGASATIAPNAANPPRPKLLNIATRMRVEQGDNALIGGFIVTGNAPKKVLIRALGPSLGTAGIAGALDDPTLELNTPGGTVFNNNWRDTQEGEISATGIPPSDEREAAIIATLDPGQGYTAVVRGNGDTTGVGLVEVYDLDSAADSQLANISTRGLVQTGDNVMIGGFIVDGPVPAKMLVRAIGPSLAQQEVQGALADTELELVDANGTTITNDDWLNTQQSEIEATGIPPSDSQEAAILATLTPGAYTAVVRGKDGATGIGLVEAYNLQ